MNKSADLLREQLASIKLSDLIQYHSGDSVDGVEEKLDAEEMRQREGAAMVFYELHFKDFLRYLIAKQSYFMARKAQSMEELCVGRGTINGFILIDEWFNEQIASVRAKGDTDKEQ